MLPLLGLTVISLINLQGLLTPSAPLDPQAVSGRPIGLLWASVNLISLLIALRACWDPPASDPAPWLQLNCPAWLSDTSGSTRPCTITAISESGVELMLPGSELQDLKGQDLSWCPQVPAMPISLVQRRDHHVALRWPMATNDPRKQALIRWLYGRPGCWPDRQAQGEWKALLVLLSRIVRPAAAPGPLQRSLMRQQLS